MAYDARSYPDRVAAIEAGLAARRDPNWLALGPAETSAAGRNDFHSLQASAFTVPILGRRTWALPQDETTVPVQAWASETSDGLCVGYLRVPDYQIEASAVETVGRVARRFEGRVDVVVLDQRHNPGGSLLRGYGVLSHLTDRPLAVPRHVMALGEDDVADAEEAVWLAEDVTSLEAGVWPSPEEVAYSRWILGEAAAGRTGPGKRTEPGHPFGVDRIEPGPHPFTGPLVVLVDELSFSTPEFVAAIVQDEGRGTLFGTRTAGAGGLMRRFTLPGSEAFGIAEYTLPWTLAVRANGEYIENRGVHPDVEYNLTVEDIQAGFLGYRDALLAAVRGVVHGKVEHRTA
jgi:C-terminal processing protease CtpA/Prc